MPSATDFLAQPDATPSASAFLEEEPELVEATGEEDGFLAKINAALRKPSPPFLHGVEESVKEALPQSVGAGAKMLGELIAGPIGTARDQVVETGRELAELVEGRPLEQILEEKYGPRKEYPEFTTEDWGKWAGQLGIEGAMAFPIARGLFKPHVSPLRPEAEVPPPASVVEPTLAERITQPRVKPPVPPETPPVPEAAPPPPAAGAPVEQPSRAGPPPTPLVEPPVPPVPEAELPYTPEGKVTGIKHAITAAEREAIGLPPAEQAARRGFGEVWDEAESVATRDKERSRALVDEINKEPRALTDLEDALLLRRQIETKAEHARALEEANAKPGDEYAQARLDRARDDVQHVYNAAEVSGTETGRGLNARKMLADEDYSLANMEAELRAVVNKGEPLTPTQLKEVKKLHDDIVDWEAKYQKRVLRDIERYEQRVREGDTSPLRPSARTPREAETIELLRKREEAKMGYRRMIHEEKLRNEDGFAKTRRGLGEIQRTMRATKTAYDVSAVLRQGGFEFLSHPVEATIRLKPMVEAAASEKGQFRIMQEMRNDTETWSAAQQAKVFFSDPANPILARREELFASSVADKIPGVAMSERAYVTLLNKIRFDRFKAMRESLPKGGKPTAIEDQLIANFVNETTGRGNVGKHGGSMDTLNQVFFATRYNIARFQTLLGHPLWYKAGKGTWRVRRAIGKEYLRALRGMGLVIGGVTGAGVYGAGGTIEPDPRSSDFGKLKVGDRRYDLTLGMGQAATFLSRIFLGSTKTAEGEIRPLRGDVPFGQGTASDVIWRYLRGKAAPGLGAGINVASGQKVTGQPTSAIQELLELPFPMSGGEAVDALQAEGVPAKLAGVLAAQLGMGVQSYEKETTATRNAKRDRIEARDLALMRGDITEATRLTKEMIMREPAETTEEGNLARQIRKQEAKAARQRRKLLEQGGGP